MHSENTALICMLFIRFKVAALAVYYEYLMPVFPQSPHLRLLVHPAFHQADLMSDIPGVRLRHRLSPTSFLHGTPKNDSQTAGRL